LRLSCEETSAALSFLNLRGLCVLCELCLKLFPVFSYSLQQKKSGPDFHRGRSLLVWVQADYWTWMLMAAAAGVAAGVVVTAMVDVPDTVKLSVPLCDASVVESPR